MGQRDLDVLEKRIAEGEKKEAERKKAEMKQKLKKERKSFWAEFKKFITRGNVVDMAVGVAVASAFTAIVTAFTKGFISPILALLSNDASLSDLKYVLRPALYEAADGTTTTIVENAKGFADGAPVVAKAEVALLWGAFIQAIIDFLIIAFALFLLLKIVMAVTARVNKIKSGIQAEMKSDEEKAAEAKAKAEAEAKAAAEKAAAEAKAAEEAAEAARKEEEQRLFYENVKAQRELLSEIKALLAEKK